MRRKHLRFGALALALLCLGGILALPAFAREDPIERAKKGVVKLYVVGYDEEGNQRSSTGSGFAVGEAKRAPEYFITNWHVAHLKEGDSFYHKDNVRIWIMLDHFSISERTGLPREATAVECSIIGSPESGYPDYAVLKASRPVTECRPLTTRSSREVQVREDVIALGFPGIIDELSSYNGSFAITETSGNIAQTAYTIAQRDNTKTLLHDALLSGGSFGGPLVDTRGNVIGLNAYGIEGGYSCSVYIDYVTDALQELGIPYEKAGIVPRTHLVIGAVGAAAVLVGVFFLLLRWKQKWEPPPLADKVLEGCIGEKFSLVLPDGRIIPILQKIITVGRSPSCEVVLPETAVSVSWEHCTLEHVGKNLILVDKGSSNGTFIHGKRVPNGTKVALRRGSSFCVGNLKNRITVR